MGEERLVQLDKLQIGQHFRLMSGGRELYVISERVVTVKCRKLYDGAGFKVGGRIPVIIDFSSEAMVSAEVPFVVTGSLMVDSGRHTVTLDSKKIYLTKTEFSLLALLVSNTGKVLTYQTILGTIWGPEYVDDDHILKAVLCRLREKIGKGYIRTVYKVGLVFEQKESE